MGRSFWIGIGIGLLVAVGCADREETREKEADRMLVSARDLEEDLGSLQKAIDRYREISDGYPNTLAGRKAQDRYRGLQQVQLVLSDEGSVPRDSLPALYGRAVEHVPDYFPVLSKLGMIYYNNTYLHARTAIRLPENLLASNVLRLWARQDSLWSNYPFRATHGDREWRDRLCKQALDVARMLQQFEHYGQALEIVNRGLEYAWTEDTIAHARVFASYYMFWKGQYREATEVAEQALSYEFLSEVDKSRAYHVIGLCYSQIYVDSRELSDLDTAIKALNEAVVIDPTMGKAKEMLKGLRVQREKLLALSRVSPEGEK